MEEDMVARFEPMIRSIARSYVDKIAGSESYDDLVQVARMGFLDAMRRFDEDISPAFIPYARNGIKLAIRQYLNTSMRLIRLPKSAVESAKKLGEAYESIESDYSDDEVMALTGFTPLKLRNAERAWLTQMPYSLDYEYGDGFTIVVEDPERVDENVEEEMMLSRLSDSMMDIEEDERFIINSLYGSFGCQKLTVSEIASMLSVSESTVRKRARRTEKRLYTMLCS